MCSLRPDTRNTLVVLNRLGYHWGVDEDLRKVARELGRRGGLKGGKARAERLTPEQRTMIAKKAAEARWAKKRQQEEESS